MKEINEKGVDFKMHKKQLLIILWKEKLAECFTLMMFRGVQNIISSLKTNFMNRSE